MRIDSLQAAVVEHAQADMAASPSMWIDPPEPASNTPSSAAVLFGEWDRGLKDLQNAVLDPWNGQVATHEQPGTIANPTQAQITQDVGTVWGHHEDQHLPTLEPMEPSMPEQEMEIE